MDSESGFTTGTNCIARFSSNKDSRTFSSTPLDNRLEPLARKRQLMPRRSSTNANSKMRSNCGYTVHREAVLGQVLADWKLGTNQYGGKLHRGTWKPAQFAERGLCDVWSELQLLTYRK